MGPEVDVSLEQDNRWKRSSTDTTQSLPWELLHLIFQYAVAPSFLMIPDRCRHSAWSLNISTLRRLIIVCHDWYEAGIELLYVDVAVYWIEQLSSLLWTLQNRPDLAFKLLSIHIVCHVPPDHVEAFDLALKSFASICPNLTQLSAQFVHVHPSRYSRILPAFSGIPLTHLAIHSDDARSSTDLVYLFSESLVSLALYARDALPTSSWTTRVENSAGQSGQLRFPRLQYFQHDLEGYQLQFICVNWEFPALAYLTCLKRRWNHSYLALADNLEFIRTHGRKISTLFLGYSIKDAHEYRVVEMIETLSGMTQLRHLIMPSFDDLSIPQIQCLDLFSSDNILPPISDLDSRFPNLKSYRLLDSSLFSLPWIYTMFPPTGQRYEFRYPGISIRADECSLRGTSSSERSLVRGEDLLFTSDSDSESDWVPSSDDDTGPDDDTQSSEHDTSGSDSEIDCEISEDEFDEYEFTSSIPPYL
ncbi:hypothetical protein GGU11DRAFT_841342 [Lentinula aff. detonsa]|nr:hypothetical protein GGU11DRAFT_841342 [Lentinula aff. detonsa]